MAIRLYPSELTDWLSTRHTFRKRSHNDSTPGHRVFEIVVLDIAAVDFDRCADARRCGAVDLCWWLHGRTRDHQAVRTETVDRLKQCSGSPDSFRRTDRPRPASGSEIN